MENELAWAFLNIIEVLFIQTFSFQLLTPVYVPAVLGEIFTSSPVYVVA